jgi:hypothetical protein
MAEHEKDALSATVSVIRMFQASIRLSTISSAGTAEYVSCREGSVRPRPNDEFCAI